MAFLKLPNGMTHLGGNLRLSIQWNSETALHYEMGAGNPAAHRRPGDRPGWKKSAVQRNVINIRV